MAVRILGITANVMLPDLSELVEQRIEDIDAPS
jgi:hypothetical protein